MLLAPSKYDLKGQGQENERVGLYLPSPVFAHGQLYKACQERTK